MEQYVGHIKSFPRGPPWSERLIAATKDQLTDPDNPSTTNQDRFESGIQRTALVPVLRLPVLHIMEGQTSVVIPIVITMPPGTCSTHSQR